MENSEGGQSSPQLFAIEQMQSQLDFNRTEQTNSAVQNIATAALHADNPATKMKALDILGNYAGKQFGPSEFSWRIPDSQDKARQRMLAIALSEDNTQLQAAAIDALAKGLDVTDFPKEKGRFHRMIVQNIAIVASAAGDPAVKNKAIEHLSKYAGKKVENKGYVGHTAVPQIQQLANDAIGAITTMVNSSQST